ncbi:MFS transporter [Streptomyces cellostaticus]|uniref:MFS transporter n=1 Tax=Streptomyces cellostaticus TaxID=67285 RepID=A0A101NHK4_9ACTN|nr:MFS transporter [Streptomyces cellostaticus]KUM93371.1 MFS transporter [Streptomyces cellostaticus]GHI02287.1 MFS transporter [Streptomyces cellostaticus]
MSQTTAAAGGVTAPAPIGVRLDRMPITPLHRRLTAVIGVGLFFDTFENNLSGTIGKVLQSDFGFGATSLKLVLASVFVGQFIGSLTLGRIADRFGRRRAFLINLAIYSVFSLLGAFSPNAAWLIVTRFFAGIGIGAEQALSDCYLADVLPAKKRGRFIAWAYTLAFCGVPAVGFAALWLVPLTPLGVAGWRWLFVLGALGSAVVWGLRRQLIESPRWLAATGRTAQAERLVARMEAEAAGRGLPMDAPPEVPRYAVDRLRHPGGWSRPAAEPHIDAVPRPFGAQPRLRDVLGPGLLRRTLVLWLFCVLSVVGYYGFGTLAPQIVAAKGYGIVAGLGFTALSFLGYPVGSALALPVVDRIERRTLIALSATAMVVAGLGFAYADSAAQIVTCGFAYTLCSNVFSSVSHVYLSEQYPTAIRATASGAAYSLSKLSAAALPFVLLPVLDAHGPGALFAVIAAAMAVLAVTVLTLGERTTGTPVK